MFSMKRPVCIKQCFYELIFYEDISKDLKKQAPAGCTGSKPVHPVTNMCTPRPSSNKKSFPVHRPGGLRRAYWNFFFHLFKIFFTFPPVHSSLKKLKLGKKKKIPTSQLAIFFPTRPTGNDFLLKGGPSAVILSENISMCK